MDTSVFTTVMFADLTGSTALYKRLGDEQANHIINDAVNMMSRVTVKNSGSVVKTIGDEVMSCFSNVDNAFAAACAIQENLNQPQAHGVIIQAHIGFHSGQAIIREDGDVFGDVVNVAARVSAIAKGNQIITSKDTVDLLSPENQSECREFDHIPLKGRSEETTIYEVLWEADDVTRMSTMLDFGEAMPAEKQLHLKYQGKELSLNTDSSAISLGRGVQCDFIINSTHASRLHAIIEFRRGKFVIIDQSTNGTFVKAGDGKEIYLRREALPLLGDGVISLGINTSQENPHQILFSIS